MKKQKDERGFTLMELMVVIVIVAILAAVAVPLYINYVKDARRTEAKAAIGALATAMEEYYLRQGLYATGIPALTQTTPQRNTNLDQTTVDEMEQHWNITITASGGTTGYTLTLNGDGDAYAGLQVKYVYLRGTGGTITEQ